MIARNPQGPGFFLFFQEETFIGGNKRDKGCKEEVCDEDDLVVEMLTQFLKSR